MDFNQPQQQQQPTPPAIRYIEKSAIIHRDENGFGLRVGGQNPVYVDFVHENGEAWKSGVRKDDRIIKINGTLVKSYDHQRVVHMIQNCTSFVNLILHTPEPVLPCMNTSSTLDHNSPSSSFNNLVSSGLQSITATNEQLQPNNSGLNSLLSSTSNEPQQQQQQQHQPSNNNSIEIHSLHQRLHSHQNSSNQLDWLLDIGDDLFQDNQQKQHINSSDQLLSKSPNTQHNNNQIGGVSKLIMSGPSPIITTSSGTQLSSTGSSKPKLRHNSRNNQQVNSQQDNPYYYYKTAPDKSTTTTTTDNNLTSNLSSSASAAASLSDHQGTSTKSTNSSSLSIVRSRSSSKMSTRSTTSKFKTRNLGSRLVDDLKSLTITNSQASPSSLSTSPSSSDLSDCDDHDSSRFDCISMNTSSSSTSALMTATTTTSVATSTTTTAAINTLSSNVSASSLLLQNSQGETGLRASGLTNNSGANCEPADNNGVVKVRHTTRRLEIIRELIDTEKAHTERLKHLNDLLYKPIKAEGLVSTEQLKMVFSCHKTLFKVHRQIYKLLLGAQQNNTSDVHQEPLVGKALIEIFEGELGKSLEKAASTFCACQSTNTEVLNRFTKKDTKVGEFLAQVANQQLLGRLGIKDLLASCFQRLTRYPLLLENLLKATPTVTTGSTTLDEDYAYERQCISRALYQSRQILIHVNDAVKSAISHNKLREIWKKTDKYPSLPVINIETQQLLHEGPLTLRLARRSIEVYVLLLTHYIVILTREGQDKYKLKYFTADGKSAKQFSPIFNIDEHLATRDTATDENGFYLLCKRKDSSRIYEFASQSPAERIKWKEKIHMAQLSCNYSVIPDDENTLTRYRELITLATSSNIA